MQDILLKRGLFSTPLAPSRRTAHPGTWTSSPAHVIFDYLDVDPAFRRLTSSSTQSSLAFPRHSPMEDQHDLAPAMSPSRWRLQTRRPRKRLMRATDRLDEVEQLAEGPAEAHRIGAPLLRKTLRPLAHETASGGAETCAGHGVIGSCEGESAERLAPL
jgi:hypothetical protein